jgi:DNA-binding MarR family transcriptional regulator
MTDPPIERRTLPRTYRAQSLTRRRIVAEMLQSLRTGGYDISDAQLLTLLLLFSRGAQSERSIADTLGLRGITIAAMWPPLVARGLVIRTPGVTSLADARVMLSTAGRRFVNNVIYRQGSDAGVFERMPVSDEDLRRRAIEALPAA